MFSSEADTPALGTVARRLYDASTLRVWALLAETFRGISRAGRLLDVTGGWLVLVERAADQAVAAADEVSTFDRLEAHLATAAGATELVDLVGPALTRSWPAGMGIWWTSRAPTTPTWLTCTPRLATPPRNRRA